jgi:glycosyltransferase involved in cell wall biosynthesis
MHYLFSVIIPFFNAEKTLKKCVFSILKQKRKDTEIVLIDDGSNDKSKKIYVKLKKKYSFIKVMIHKRNQGIGISRNDGIHISSGQYIIWLDSDDSLYPKSLYNLEKTIKNKDYPDLIIVKHKKSTYPNSNQQLIDDINYTTKKPEKLINYLNKTKVPFADCWFFSVKRDLILKNKIFFPNARFGESEYFVAKTICFIKSYDCCNKYFYSKNDRVDSLNSSDDYNATVSVLESLIKLNTFLKLAHLSAIKKSFINKYIEDGLGVFSTLLILRNNQDLTKLSKFINKNNMFRFEKVSKKHKLFSLIAKYGSIDGLLNYRKKIISTKIKLMNKLKSRNKNIYIYCKGKYAAATITILKKYKYTVKAVIDDSYIFEKNNFLNYKTTNSKIFFKQNKNILSKAGVIITHQKIGISKKIYNFLIKKGLKKNQIISIRY